MSVTPIDRAHRDTVEMLRDLLAEAEAGGVTGIMCAVDVPEGTRLQWSRGYSFNERLGRLELIKYEMLAKHGVE